MELHWAEAVKKQVGKWLWTPKEEFSHSVSSRTQTAKPASFQPVKNKKRHSPLRGRGDKREIPKRVDKLYYRGPRLHHEIAEHHVNKAVLPYRGKGTHDRRSVKREKPIG
jgi:hypothetical protein